MAFNGKVRINHDGVQVFDKYEGNRAKYSHWESVLELNPGDFEFNEAFNIIFIDLYKKFEDLNEKYDDLQNKYDELTERYDEMENDLYAEISLLEDRVEELE